MLTDVPPHGRQGDAVMNRSAAQIARRAQRAASPPAIVAVAALLHLAALSTAAAQATGSINGAPAANSSRGPGSVLMDLLKGYPTRPPWKVAGVDYPVGVPTGVVLQDPFKIHATGVSINPAAHSISISGSNVALNGYDFGLDGGWSVTIVAGAKGTLIENSRFQVGQNKLVPLQASVGAGSVTIRNNTFDGGGGEDNAIYALATYNGSGTFIAENNIFKNAPADAIDFNAGTMTTIVRRNLFYNLGTTSGSHPDSVQYVAVNSDKIVIAYNTIFQPNPSGMEGIQLAAQNGSTLANAVIEKNVIIATPGSLKMSYSIAVQQAAHNTVRSVRVRGNYVDPRGAYGAFYPPSGSDISFGGNIDIARSQPIPPPAGAAGT
jgi:hypothetical protein